MEGQGEASVPLLTNQKLHLGRLSTWASARNR